MNLIAKSITFNGRSLPDGYALCSFDTLDLMNETYIKQTINKSEITPHRPYVHLYNSSYQEPLQFTIDVIKCSGKEWSDEEFTDFVRWFTAPTSYVALQVTDFDGITYHNNIEYLVKCTGFDEFTTGDKIVGLRFYFECNAPFGYSTEQIISFTGGETLEIDNQTDELSSDNYPVIELTCNATEEVQIVNEVYPKEVLKLQVLEAQILTIDNEYGLIYDNLDMFNFETDTNMVWIRLAPGINTLSITGNVSGELRYRYIRKRGI